jgi:pimeloyl-ACP methyl ester carboxylesterase
MPSFQNISLRRRRDEPRHPCLPGDHRLRRRRTPARDCRPFPPVWNNILRMAKAKARKMLSHGKHCCGLSFAHSKLTQMTETLNGNDLYFEIHGAGEPLLLLHGFSGSSQDWKPSIGEWGTDFQLVIPDLRGHGRSSILSKPFRHRDAAADVLALLDRLEIHVCKGVGISAGGNVLLHMATQQPRRVKAMALVSATPYFPAQARPIMRRYPDTMPEEQWEILRSRHPGGDTQIRALMDSTRAFADSYDDLTFTPPHLATIQARTLIVQGDRDPLYPVEISVEMAKAIPLSTLWIVPNGGHGAVLGERWPEFVRTAAAFLRD